MAPAGPAGGALAGAGAFHLQGDGGGRTQRRAPQSRTPRGEQDSRTRSKRFPFHVHWVVALLPHQQGGTARSVFAEPTLYLPLAEVRRPSAMPGAAARSRCRWDYNSRHALHCGRARSRGPTALAGGRAPLWSPSSEGRLWYCGWYRRGAMAHEGGNTPGLLSVAGQARQRRDGWSGSVRGHVLSRSLPSPPLGQRPVLPPSPASPGRC
ncbi:uncharacterized protein LOC141729688 [Zonotrichia albicollis]|uniref:uncharacterized protein LOC141729688 n=1 Tax=Zonotrichia albicollis TaxID=44394 RepID=UPI003D80D22B